MRARPLAAILVVGALTFVAGGLLPAAHATPTVTTAGDAYVDKKSPTRNFATANPLKILRDTTTTGQIAYEKFTSDTAGSGTLRIYFNASAAGSVDLHATDSTWTEAGITWNARPPVGALLDTRPLPASTGYVTFNVPTVVVGDNSFAVVSLSTATKSQAFVSEETSNADQKPLLTVTPPPTTTTTTTTTTLPPPTADWLADSQLKTTEVAAWQPDGQPAVNATVSAKVRQAGATTGKISAHDCFAAEGSTPAQICGRDNHTGTLDRAAFRAKVQGVINGTDGWAVRHLELKIAPLTKDVLNGIDGDLFCPQWTGDTTFNQPMYRAQVDEIANAGWTGDLVLTYSEPEFSCVDYWKSPAGGSAPISGAGSMGVSKRLGEMYAENIPQLRDYAISKGVFAQVYTEGYIGVPGGPEWAGTPSTFCQPNVNGPYGWTCGYNTRWVGEFLTALDTAAAPYPNELTTHIYVHGPDMDCGPGGTLCSYGGTGYDGYNFDDNMAFSYFANWATQTRALLSQHGHPEVKLGIGEGNNGVSRSGDAWCGWANTCAPGSGWTPSTPSQFLTGWLQMLKDQGYHTFNLFCVACNSDAGPGGNYDVVKQDGSESSYYPAWAAFAP